jgi:hypothetical protein
MAGKSRVKYVRDFAFQGKQAYAAKLERRRLAETMSNGKELNGNVALTNGISNAQTNGVSKKVQ